MRTCPSCRALAPEGAPACPSCGAAFAAAKFRLHPATGEDAVARPPPARAPTPPAATFTPRPPPPAPASSSTRPLGATAPARKPIPRSAIVGGAILAAILLIGGTTYALTSPAFGYPERYMLEEDEMPPGAHPVSIPAQFAGEYATDKNPGKLKESTLDDMETAGIRPKEGWLQSMSNGGLQDLVLVIPLLFDSAGDADKWLESKNERCDGDVGSVLQDRRVVVLVIAPTGNDALAANVAEAIEDKAPKLSFYC